MQLITKRLLSLSLGKFSFSNPVKDKTINIFVADDMLQLVFPLKQGSKLMYVNQQYTFQTLIDVLKIETLSKVNLEFDHFTTLEPDSNLIKYILEDQSNPPISIYIDDEKYMLTPAYQVPSAKLVSKVKNLPSSPSQLYDQCVNSKMDPSHASPLSWFVTFLNKKLQLTTSNLTQTEISHHFNTCLYLLASPINRKLNYLKHQKNVIEAEILKMLKEKKFMEEDASKNAYLWISGIFALSVMQIFGFYYGIYMVEDWGWNVCEPVTYSLQCLSVLITLRFYLKYRKQRSAETILNAFFINRMNNNRIWRDRYNYLTETLKLKNHEKHMIEQQILLYQNRINYDNYVSTQESQAMEIKY